MSRVVVWFSCGVPSACAAKLAVDKYGDKVMVVYCDTSEDEHIDNRRFYYQVETWVGVPFTTIGSEKYNSVEDVWRARKYMAGIKGAPCTTEMKKIPRFNFQLPGDLNIFGYTVDERGGRIENFEALNPELDLEWILKDKSMTRDECERMVIVAGISLPAMYGLGFKNNNCIGCVKATSPAYWNKTRQHFPEVFQSRAAMSRELGARLTRVNGKRIFLDELEPSIGMKEKITESISCGPECSPTPNKQENGNE